MSVKSRRNNIVSALVEKLKDIDGTNNFNTNLFTNAYSGLKFWDQVNDFPSVYAVSGQETREYLPGDFKWGYLAISIKVYCKGEDSSADLEALLEDIESVVDDNRVLVYNDNGDSTTEILVTSIVTDEGLLSPYAIGEMNLQVRYAL